MAYDPQPGDALLIASGPQDDPDRKHLFVIITSVDEDGNLGMVSISTIREGQSYDDACTLQPGDHPFIKSPSFVAYRTAQQHQVRVVAKCVDGFLYQRKEAVSAVVLQRIEHGALVSRFIPRYMRAFVQGYITWRDGI